MLCYAFIVFPKEIPAARAIKNNIRSKTPIWIINSTGYSRYVFVAIKMQRIVNSMRIMNDDASIKSLFFAGNLASSFASLFLGRYFMRQIAMIISRENTDK